MKLSTLSDGVRLRDVEEAVVKSELEVNVVVVDVRGRDGSDLLLTLFNTASNEEILFLATS